MVASQSQPVFGNNRVLLFAVDPWSGLGFGAPNPGDSFFSQNMPIVNLVDEIGKCQLMLMLDVTARGWQPPNVDVARKMAAMYNRVASVLALQMKLEGQTQLPLGKADQSARPFMIHPVPYFDGPMVVNPWMRDWNELVMVALINMMQHSSNNRGLVVTQQFASEILPFFKAIAVKLATELCDGFTPDQVLADGFLFDLSDAGPFTPAKYKPSQKVINMELISTAGPIMNVPTIRDCSELVTGIAANLILPLLKQYPLGPVPGATGLQGNPLLARDALMATDLASASDSEGTARDTPRQAVLQALADAANQAGNAMLQGTGSAAAQATASEAPTPSLPSVPPPTV
jgi:hypothetical protein